MADKPSEFSPRMLAKSARAAVYLIGKQLGNRRGAPGHGGKPYDELEAEADGRRYENQTTDSNN